MELQEKVEFFKDDLDLIADNSIRNFVLGCMDEAPDYFWLDCPSSSSSKYHSLDENSYDGSLLHSRRVFAVAYDLARGLDIESDRDVVLAAALLHDMTKQGLKKSGHTVKEHPQIMADLIARVYEEKFVGKIDVELVKKIHSAVKFHYGPWTQKEFAKPITNYTMIELAVYVADYIASKRFITVDYKRRTD